MTFLAPFGGGVAHPGLLLNTRQTTCYHVGDGGDYRKGLAESFTVLTLGQHSLTTNVDVPHYAANTLAFVSATKKITDSANLLATVLTGDTIRVRGSVSNDGVYTVATGGVAGEIVVAEVLVDEGAARYIMICKRAAPSNNCVIDDRTGLMWLRYTTGGPVQKVGAASDGKLCWYDVAKVFVLHPAAADLQMTTTGIKIIGGAGEIARYFVGAILVCSGFANAVDNLPGYPVAVVAVNGLDLDLTLQTNNQVLIAEAAAGSRAIKIVCQSIFAYVAAANTAGLAQYADWRVPHDFELASLRDMEAPTAVPNTTAFPSWIIYGIWTSGTATFDSTYGMFVNFNNGRVFYDLKTNILSYFLALVRG